MLFRSVRCSFICIVPTKPLYLYYNPYTFDSMKKKKKNQQADLINCCMLNYKFFQLLSCCRWVNYAKHIITCCKINKINETISYWLYLCEHTKQSNEKKIWICMNRTIEKGAKLIKFIHAHRPEALLENVKYL